EGHVVGGERLAVMERDPFADLEVPGELVDLRDALGDLRHGPAVGQHRVEAVEHVADDVLGVAVAVVRRVQGDYGAREGDPYRLLRLRVAQAELGHEERAQSEYHRPPVELHSHASSPFRCAASTVEALSFAGRSFRAASASQ